jgi:uncharacterized repeat protein (TIGR01451 family)
MRSRPRRLSRRLSPAHLVLVASLIELAPGAAAQEPQLDEAVIEASSEAKPLMVLVELVDAPAAVVYGEALRSATATSGMAKMEAVSAARAQIAKIESAQARFESALSSLPEPPQEIFRVDKAMNGFALQVAPGSLDELGRLPGVKRVHILVPEYPTNATSVPFLGAPEVWADTLGLGLNADGTGVTIGIIDTGIDYQHAQFGGNGVLADYQANNRTVAPDAYFPTAKVVGGWDFAGDNYAGGVPSPDPDPMDCNGHGSHVAGTAAGFGVNADGTPYAGPFTPGAAYRSLRVGPGTAPQALLYALRVFGCGGGTNLTVQAIDWAMDPDGDDDLSDHLDVINLSLGSAFGSAASTSAIAADNAAFAGVIVVASAGNSGDTFFIAGSPGSGSRVISTAATADDNVTGLLVRVNTPGGIAGFYTGGAAAFGALPPFGGVTGDVVLGLDPADGAGPLTTDACSPLTNGGAVAGNIALVDRGTCGFVVKVKNAQDAGAIGVIVANNVAGVISMVGVDPTIVIPAVSVSLADGNTLKANIATLNATLFPASDTVAGFTSRGPRRASPIRLKPDISAPGINITSAQTGVTCTGVSPSVGCQLANASGFIANSQSLALSGTSMAAPHMAGIMALLRQIHPTWTVEELKALAMNYATHDVTSQTGGNGFRHGASRVGAGRVDPAQSAVGDVIAFNSDEVGLVSVTFDNDLVGLTTRVKRLRVVNHGSTDQTFDLAIDTLLDAPGVSFSLPGGSSLVVPAGDSVEIDVQMDADTSQMDHFRDPTLAATQVVSAPGSLANLQVPRHWMTEESGFVTFSQGGDLVLRVPVYVSPRPQSRMAAADTIVTGGAGSGSTTIALSGTDVCSGTLWVGPTCTGAFPNDEVSLVTPFELQVFSPADPENLPPFLDLQYAGVAADANMIWFGVSTWGEWSSPTDITFNIYVDNNLDGTYDRVVFNTSTGTLARTIFSQAGQPDLDTFVTSVFTPPNIFSNVVALATPNFVNRLSAAAADTALHNNSVMFLGATASQLGLANVNSPFRYRIETCPGLAPLCQSLNGFHLDEAVGPYSWNGAAKGLDFAGITLAFDLDGASLPVTWNTTNMALNNSLGALLLHHHNGAGRRAEVVLLEGMASADLSITKSASPPNPNVGDNVTFTVTVTNNGPDGAGGVAVVDILPSGVTYVSDDSGGAYDNTTGLWSVGNLANAASATLEVVVTVETSEPIDNQATITASSPLDPDPSDNQATVTLQAPRTADLELSMSVSSPTVLVGGSVTYTLDVTNHGGDPAYGLDVNEAFPAFPALDPTSFTASQGVYNPATGLWNLASLGRDDSASLQITVTAPNTAGPLTNDGLAASSEADLDTVNNSASATTTVLSPSVVSVTKTVSGSFIEGSASIVYTVVLSNSGAFDQQDNPGDELTDILPPQLILTGASATSGTAVATLATNTVTWNGVVPAGGSVTVTINATVASGTALQNVTNQASFNYDPDGNGVNEGSGLSDDPGAPGAADPTAFVVISPSAVGTRTKTVTGELQPGGTVTYTVTITNPAASAQQDNPGDEFVDVLPAELVLLTASATSGTAVATPATNTVTWNGSLAANGGSVTITIEAGLLSDTAGATVLNQATIFFDADGNGTNEASVLTDDPAVGGADDATAFGVASIAAIPTVSEIGLLALGLFLAGAAVLVLRRLTL